MALRELGVHVVLDDFGIGHASIAYLRDYAFDGLKIDRSFVSGLETDTQSRAFMQAIIDMALALASRQPRRGWRRKANCRCCAAKASASSRVFCWATL